MLHFQELTAGLTPEQQKLAALEKHLHDVQWEALLQHGVVVAQEMSLYNSINCMANGDMYT